MRVLLVSTYELGHQPLQLASPAGALAAAGHAVRAVDLAVDPLADEEIDWAEAVAFSVPMHTATRLALGAARAVRARRPELATCAYGLYAGAGGGRWSEWFDRTIAGEYEAALLGWIDALAGGGGGRAQHRGHSVELGRAKSSLPARAVLPPLERYARLLRDGEEVLAGYVETTRGCVHRCRHCPVPVVYDGRIRTVEASSVVADVDRLVEMGAGHITFGDPDFLNGPRHSLPVLREVHRRHPTLTFDLTTKVEHVLRHRGIWPELAEAGVLFIVSALESTSDVVLDRLHKGHHHADSLEALGVLRRAGVELRPSLLPFTPWTELGDLVDLCDFVLGQDLVGAIDPVQYSIRLLLPAGSLLLDDPDVVRMSSDFDESVAAYPWKAADPELDALQSRIAALVEAVCDPAEAFAAVHGEITDLAQARRLTPPVGLSEPLEVRPVPRLSEAWFCCAEPTGAQMAMMSHDG